MKQYSASAALEAALPIGIGILVVLIIVVGFLLWSSTPKTAQPTVSAPMRIGLNPWIGNGVYYVAQEKGFFAKEKIRVEFVNADDIATERQLLRTGQIDVAYSLTPESVAVFTDGGVKIKIVAANDLSFGADGVIATKDIKTIEDLKGKTVAFETGSTSHFLLSYLLSAKGLTTNDLTVINTIAPDAGAAFVAGKVDAAVTWEPWLSKADERGGGHLLASSREARIIYDMPIMRADVAEKRKGDVSAMLRAVFAAQAWIPEHQEEATQIIAKQLKISPQEASDQIKGVHWLSYQENIDTLTSGEYSVKHALQAAGDLWFKLGIIKTKLDAGALVDESFIKNLYR